MRRTRRPPRERILGSTDAELFPAEVAEALREHSDRALADGERREHRIETDASGETRVLDVVHFTGSEVADRSVVGRVARDVTEHVDRERLLREERNRLEALASSVAHDARNAIQLIRGRASLAEDSLPAGADQSKEHLHTLESGVDRLEDLVASLESLRGMNDPVTDPDPVSIADAARDAWETVTAPEAVLQIHADPTVLGDPARVRTLLENLFRNSVEHAPSPDGRRAEPPADRAECRDGPEAAADPGGGRRSADPIRP
ncbi:PAS domain-containing protein [Halobaculum halobium]|uniref:PAS domain-containing protein n=1 Tax=Halobaculum halobium TaxID=3032281 RepID=UPI0036204519